MAWVRQRIAFGASSNKRIHFKVNDNKLCGIRVNSRTTNDINLVSCKNCLIKLKRLKGIFNKDL